MSDYDSDEMEECTDAYVDFVMEQYEAAKQVCEDPVILIEQRLMGKDRFEEILGDLITKAPGRPTLFPKSDRRPAMNVSNAINEFYEIKEDI